MIYIFGSLNFDTFEVFCQRKEIRDSWLQELHLTILVEKKKKEMEKQ